MAGAGRGQATTAALIAEALRAVAADRGQPDSGPRDVTTLSWLAFERESCVAMSGAHRKPPNYKLLFAIQAFLTIIAVIIIFLALRMR